MVFVCAVHSRLYPFRSSHRGHDQAIDVKVPQSPWEAYQRHVSNASLGLVGQEDQQGWSGLREAMDC